MSRAWVRPTQLTGTQLTLPIFWPCDYLFLIRYDSEVCKLTPTSFKGVAALGGADKAEDVQTVWSYLLFPAFSAVVDRMDSALFRSSR